MLNTLRQRFWDKVYLPFDTTDEDCWEWIGAKNPGGYGRMTVNTKECKLSTHVSWFLKYGVWPTLNLLHKCDCPSCINPSHLFEGTLNDNNQDMFAKGRNIKGSNTCTAILDENKVMEIIELCRQGATTTDLARLYGVSLSCISEIRTGKKWRHINR